MPRGMELVVGPVWQMRGRRFITAVGIGGAGMGCRMGMAWGWEVWGMATRGMGGWMRMIRGMIRATIRGYDPGNASGYDPGNGDNGAYDVGPYQDGPGVAAEGYESPGWEQASGAEEPPVPYAAEGAERGAEMGRVLPGVLRLHGLRRMRAVRRLRSLRCMTMTR